MSWSNTGERGWAYRGETPMKSVEGMTVETLLKERAKLIDERDKAQAALIDAALIHATLMQDRDEARAETEKMQRLLDHATQANPGTSTLVMLMNEAREAQAEVEVLRGVGCREAKEGEPESGPCGVCLRCAEERGAEWAIRAKAQVVYSLVGDAAYSLLAREVCNKAREKR